MWRAHLTSLCWCTREGRVKLQWWRRTLTVLLGRVRSLSYVNLQLEGKKAREKMWYKKKDTRKKRTSETRKASREPDNSRHVRSHQCDVSLKTYMPWGDCLLFPFFPISTRLIIDHPNIRGDLWTTLSFSSETYLVFERQTALKFDL